MKKQTWIIGFVALLCGVASVFAGTDSASSNPTTVDTRDTGKPTFTLSGNYFSPSSHAYFLNGVSVPETATAEVDWNGATTGTVTFCIATSSGSRTVIPPNGVSYSFDPGAWGIGDYLLARADSPDGISSSLAIANFDVIPRPLSLSAGEISKQDRSLLFYEADFRFPVVDVETTLASDIPYIGSRKVGLELSVPENMEINSNGRAAMKTKMLPDYLGLGFKFGDEIFSPHYQDDFQFQYNPSLEKWDLISSDVKFGMAIEVGMPGGFNFTVFGVPCYVDASMETDASATIEVDSWEHHSSPEINSEIEVDCAFKVMAGLGGKVEVAGKEFGIGVGPAGYLGLSMAVQHPEDPTFKKLALLGKLGVHCDAIVMATDLWLIEGEWIMIGENGAVPLAAMMAVENPDDSRTSMYKAFKTPPRDYLATPIPMAMADIVMDAPAAQSASEQYLNENIYPYGSSSLASDGSKQMLVWVRDNPARSNENRCELMWQQRVGDSWSIPLAINDNGTADIYPALKSLGTGSYVCAWSDQGSELPAGADLGDAITGSEISVAVFNPDTEAWNTSTLTSDNAYDTLPALSTCSNGTAMAVWKRNAYTNFIGSIAEPNDLYFSVYNGTNWGNAQPAATNLGVVAGYDVAYNGSEATLVYVLDTDADPETPEDQELFSCIYSNGIWSAPVQVTDNTVEDNNPQVVSFTDGSMELYWLEDGVLRTQAEYPFGTNSVIGRGFDLVVGSNDEKALFWENGDIQIAFYDELTGGWSLPVAQTATEDILEKRLSACFTTNGNLLISHNRDIMATDTNGYWDVSQVDLAVIEVVPAPDAAVTAVSLSEEFPMPGNTVDISVEVANLGELACSNLTVNVYEGDPDAGGILIGSTNVPGWFIGGAETNLSVTWEVPSETVPPQIVAVASTAGMRTDKDEANNEFVQEVLGLNFSVDSVEVKSGFENTVILSATVQNSGSLSYTNGVDVNFCLNSPSGTVIGEDTVYPAAPRSEYDASMEWDLSAQTFTSAFETVYAVLDPTNNIAELDESDNSSFAMVMTTLDSDDDGLLDGEEVRFGTSIGSADSDNDGLDDVDELTTHGTSPINSDTDSDGSGDGSELIAGTDPQNSSSVFCAEISQADGFVVRWDAVTGRVYNVYWTPSLTEPFHPLEIGIQYPQNSYTDTVHSAESSSYYRVVVMRADYDADGDGLPNDWEAQYAVADAYADGDEDGFSNMAEFIAGTNPTNGSSFFNAASSVDQVNGTNCFVVEWISIPDRIYSVHWTTNLSSGFQVLESGIKHPQNSYTDTVHSAETEGYYKVDVKLK